ncbi:MAG: NAD(P)-binding domain-containing protein [Candidatus Limnocylindrales bacterium]
MPRPRLDALVVGAGQAGLAASYELQRAGLEHVVLERGRIGETLRAQRWDSFRLNTPNWMNLLPGETEALEPRDGFVSQAAYVAQLEAYAARFQLPVQTGVDVTAVEANGSAGGFDVHVARAGAAATEPGGEVITARSVVVASGALNVPKIPALAAGLWQDIDQLPTSAYRNSDALARGAILVVGSGQSGLQVVEDLLDAGRRVYLCTSEVGRMPRRHRGRDTMAWLVELGFFDLRPEDLPDPALRYATQPVISGVGRLGHSISLQVLAERGVTLLGRPKRMAGEQVALDDSLGANIAFGDERSAFFKHLIDDWLVARGVPLPPPEADAADVPHPDPLAVHGPASLALAREEIGTVVWATGFQGDFGWLHVPVLDPRGQPIHHDGVSSVPGLYFLGFPWLSRRKSGIVLGLSDDAAFIAHHAADYVASV